MKKFINFLLLVTNALLQTATLVNIMRGFFWIAHAELIRGFCHFLGAIFCFWFFLKVPVSDIGLEQTVVYRRLRKILMRLGL